MESLEEAVSAFEAMGPRQVFEFISPEIRVSSVDCENYGLIDVCEKYVFNHEYPVPLFEGLKQSQTLGKYAHLAVVLLTSFLHSENADLVWYDSVYLTLHNLPLVKIKIPRRSDLDPKAMRLHLDLADILRKYQQQARENFWYLSVFGAVALLAGAHFFW